MTVRTDSPAPFDPATRAVLDELVDHLNVDHADTVLLVARHRRHDACDAELVSVDRVGAVLSTRAADGSSGDLHVAFDAPASDVSDVQRQLVGMVDAARLAADPTTPLTSMEEDLRRTASLPTIHAGVGRVRRLTPSLLQVTIAGLDRYPLAGGDEFVYVMVSHEPGGVPPGYGMDDYRRQDPGDPVRGAYYTVRRSRPEAGELDLWVVEHDHPGSVAAWMAAATPGDRVALWGPRAGFRPPDDTRHVLLVADESGFAAVAALVERLPPSCRATAVLQTVGAEHRPPLPDHPGLAVHWLDPTPTRVETAFESRGAAWRGTERLKGSLDRDVATVLAGLEGGDGVPDAAFGAGESREISAVRRLVRQTLGIPAARMLMTGYWRRATEA